MLMCLARGDPIHRRDSAVISVASVDVGKHVEGLDESDSKKVSTKDQKKEKEDTGRYAGRQSSFQQ